MAKPARPLLPSAKEATGSTEDEQPGRPCPKVVLSSLVELQRRVDELALSIQAAEWPRVLAEEAAVVLGALETSVVSARRRLLLLDEQNGEDCTVPAPLSHEQVNG